MILEILISTVNDNWDNIKKILLPQRDNVKYLIVNQILSGSYKELHNAGRTDTRVINCRDRGLSKSRNIAIANSTGDIALITDNDVRFREDSFRNILKAFQDHPDMDIITFQIETLPGEPPYKTYAKMPHIHTKKTIGNVSSIEIAFKVDRIKMSHIVFDENFGLGTDYPFGEENLFIRECLIKKLHVFYMPVPVVIHQYQSTLRNFVYSEKSIVAIGALAVAKFGIMAIARSFLAVIKNYKNYKKDTHPFSFFFYFQKGIRKYIFSAIKKKQKKSF